MPISKEKKALYPANWDELSKRVRETAGQRCQQCKAPNGQQIARGCDVDAGTYMVVDGGAVFSEIDGELLGVQRGSEYDADRFLVVVLTVAHLDQDPTNNALENLRALCQKCHLAHDKHQHIASARATRRARKAVGNLPGIE